MNVRDILKKAEEMEVDPKYALSCRKRYLAGLIFTREMNIQAWDFQTDDLRMDYFRELLAIDDVKAIAEIKWEIKRLDRALIKFEGQITDEMIERARAYPIERLIPFQKGAALAWCHDDKNPSLTWDRKRNRAKCWPCDKSFDSISVLMERDGMSFRDAVKQLAH